MSSRLPARCPSEASPHSFSGVSGGLCPCSLLSSTLPRLWLTRGRVLRLYLSLVLGPFLSRRLCVQYVAFTWYRFYMLGHKVYFTAGIFVIAMR